MSLRVSLYSLPFVPSLSMSLPTSACTFTLACDPKKQCGVVETSVPEASRKRFKIVEGKRERERARERECCQSDECCSSVLVLCR